MAEGFDSSDEWYTHLSLAQMSYRLIVEVPSPVSELTVGPQFGPTLHLYHLIPSLGTLSGKFSRLTLFLAFKATRSYSHL